MRFPPGMSATVLRYTVKQRMSGRKRFPSVLMLEPLYACNLACLGCALERHTGKLADRVPLERCLQAADDCGAPVVSICGGEPTLYPELKELVQGLIEKGRYIFLCTNALLLDKRVFDVIAPHKQLFLNIHLDGLRDTHDLVCDRKGVYNKALEMIRESKRRGYVTMTNTTIFKETSVEEVEALCRVLDELSVDGMLISPGYHYESVDRDIFLTQDDIHQKFRRLMPLSKQYRLTGTPAFMEFAAGLRELPCSPYSTVTYTPRGWKGPCYLIGDRYFETWEEFWNGVDWDYWERRVDRRCANCKMHSGFEASALKAATSNPKDMVKLAMWSMSG
jgi:hopanoid biosynthesis associated radical SAM protein HpnH